ncbi:RlpA-like double-psi beta-barrel domain [Phytophthora cactorum]|nr:RlpA-like double-psi beta-barrel domain [Phytophthora cactorum]
MKAFSLIVTAATLAVTNADEYFTGDATAYTLGQTSAGNCNMMSALDFATTDYAALNNEQWDGLQNCGRCAEVSCADDRCADQSTSVVVQILDRCPECKQGDLDLSPSVFKTLTGSHPPGTPSSGSSWTAPCRQCQLLPQG